MSARARTVRTTCAYCGVGCGIEAKVSDRGDVTISGDPSHPANHGRLCSKGAALGATLGPEGRVLRPEIAGKAVTWDHAIARVAAEFRTVIEQHGPDAVAFYVSGQLLTEDYYVANKLMKGFIGSANIDTNSRLCMASSVAGHKRAFGEDVVPGTYDDFEHADLVVLVGSNLAWCHPVLHQRLLAARATRGTRLVVIDPRATATAAECDLHLALRHGSDVALFNGLLRWLRDAGAIDRDYVGSHTQGFDAALAAAERFDLDEVAALTGLERGLISTFYGWFTAQAKTVTVYSQGVNQSTAGTDKVNAIINCHLATGRIGVPGAGPFSVTGQPNAMGGREVGGLANTLAAHIDFNDTAGVEAVQQFWRAPRLARTPGLKAVQMFEAVRRGEIKALWIMATNPAVSMPDGRDVVAALEACPFVVVSDVVRQADTAAHADVLLPALGWGEKSGTVTNSERCISRQRAFLPAPAQARADWWQLAAVGRRMGYTDAFAYRDPASIYAEYVQMTQLRSGTPRKLVLDTAYGVDALAYEDMRPHYWPPARVRNDANGPRLYGHGNFSTPDGRARFVAIDYHPPARRIDPMRRFVLSSGRVRDQWHTMTRSGLAARLSGHIAEPFVEIHPADALQAGISEATIVALNADSGPPVLVRALLTRRVRRGSLFVPMHFSEQHASAAHINRLFAGACDPLSGQPELKHTTVAAAPFAAAWYGFAVARSRPADPAVEYWARMRSAGGWRLELAAAHDTDIEAFFRCLCGPTATKAEIVHYTDAGTGSGRWAAFHGRRLVAALYTSREPVAVSRSWVASMLDRSAGETDPSLLLAGRERGDDGERGALICACHGVGSRAIERAIAAGDNTLEAIGARTLAGTGCGSCRMEIQRLFRPVTAVAIPA